MIARTAVIPKPDACECAPQTDVLSCQAKRYPPVRDQQYPIYRLLPDTHTATSYTSFKKVRTVLAVIILQRPHRSILKVYYL